MVPERQRPDLSMVHVWALSQLLLQFGLWIWGAVLIALLIAGANVGLALAVLLVSVLIGAGTSYAWAFLHHRFYSWQFGDEQMHIWRGILFRRRLTIPYMRIQNATVVQGPILMMFGLSNIVVETAGLGPLPYGLSSKLGAYLPGVPDGERMADAIIEAAKRVTLRDRL